jgi:hypothetical protein
MTSNIHDIRARDPEREALARQLEEWRAAGGIPEIVTDAPRQDRMSASQEERNLASWENRNEAI